MKYCSSSSLRFVIAAALTLVASACSDGASGDDTGDGGSGGSGGQAGADAGDSDSGTCTSQAARFATGVVAHQFGDGQNIGQNRFPELVLGPPRGAGCCNGSMHTVSIGNGGTVTVEFAGNAIVDGPGPDFIVFENAFEVSGGGVFAELGTVEVSEDGQSWAAYPCTAVEPPYDNCAGHRAVFANELDNEIDPLDPAVAGGDPFDLAELGLQSARYVRITDRADQVGLAGVFDLDAVGIVNARCP